MLAMTQLIGFGALSGGGNDSFTKVLLHFDGADAGTSIIDDNIGGSAHTWTANGNAQLDTDIAPKFGSASLLCDGTGDYVTTPDSTDFTLGSGDFTIDFWFNRQSGDGTNRYMAGQSDGVLSNATLTAWAIRLATTNVVTLLLGGASFSTFSGTTAFTSTGWHHVAAVRTGNVVKLFVDGTQEGADHAFSASIPNVTSALSVGRTGALTTLNFPGLIDEFRMSVGIARWTANFTPPIEPYSA